MSHKMLQCVGLALMVIGSLLAGSVSATLIDVTNASFEDPALSDGGTNAAQTHGWLFSLSGDGAQIFHGIYDPTSDVFTPPDGENVFSSYLNAGSSNWAKARQTLTDTLTAGTYTLTVAVGKDLGSTPGADFNLDITTSVLGTASPLASYSGLGTELTAGSAVNKSISFVVALGNPHIGEAVMIAFGTTGMESAAGTHFDTVRLDFVPVPEPGTLALLASGLLGLLCYAWRKRR